MSAPLPAVGSPEDNSMRARSVAMIRTDFESQDYEVLLDEASDITGAIVHWFGCQDGDASFGSLVVDQLYRIAEFVHSQPCTCPSDVVENGEVCGRCRALCLVANKADS